MQDVMNLLPAVLLLGVGLCCILLARALKTSAIVTFIAAGVLIGPHAFGIISPSPATNLLAQLGVVFLLFEIGLGFSLKSIRESGRDLFSLAPTQMLACAAGFGAMGWMAGLSWEASLMIGLAAGISATSVVSQTLSERNLVTCPLGRSTTAVLVFQDIAGIFLLVFAGALLVTPGESGPQVSLGVALGLAALNAALAAIAAILIGRYVANPAFRLLARTGNDEVFTAAALFIVLATAAATGALGLSLTLGAFLAGMIVAETPYRHVIRTEARPFGALLLGFFFITVGMGLDWRVMLDQAHWIAAALFGLLAVKTVLTILAALANGWSRPGAIQLGFILAQGSEFGLVILALPGVAAALGPQATAVLVAASAISLAATPAWIALGMKLARRVAAQAKRDAPAAPSAGERPILLFAMNDVGRLALDALTRFQVPVVAIESDPDRFLAAMSDGYPVTFGDPSDYRLMKAVGVTNARALALAKSRYEISADVTEYVRKTYPDLARFVAVDDEEALERHAELGMHAVITRGAPPGLDFAAALLRFADVPEADIAAWMRDVMDAYEPMGLSELQPA